VRAELALFAVVALFAVIARFAVVALFAVAATSALLAVVAVVAMPAVTARVADGTRPSRDSRISAPVNELFLTLIDVTAFLFSCAVPTLFLGSVAAHAVPPRAIESAMHATTIGGEGALRTKRRKSLVFSIALTS
jgi:hypothetical protein